MSAPMQVLNAEIARRDSRAPFAPVPPTPGRGDYLATDAAAEARKDAVYFRREAATATGLARHLLRVEMREAAKRCVFYARRFRALRT